MRNNRSARREFSPRTLLFIVSMTLCHANVASRLAAAPPEPASPQADSLAAPSATVRQLASDMKFTEGPVWMPAANRLIFSDIPNNLLMQWTPTDGLETYRKSEGANGNILDREQRLISCQHVARNLIRTEPDGSITVLADRFEGKRLNSPNDVAIRSDGTLWFTDPPWGLFGKGISPELPGNWVFKLSPDSGKLEPVIKDMAMPNGICFSPDESRLYVADTGGHPKHQDPAFRDAPDCVRYHAITDDGNLGEKLFQIDEGSDGMTVDEKGNLYTTHNGHVNIFSPNGKLLQRIKVPENPANVCFGGKDNKTLFITARTALYGIAMRNAGVTLPARHDPSTRDEAVNR